MAQRPEFAAVARLVRDESTSGGGGGVLIAPDWVLTAAHVVDRWQPGADYRWEWAGASAGFAEVLIHPEYHATSLDGRVDLALVRLERPVTDVVPAKLHDAATELGRRAALVGYGTAQPANSLGGFGDQTPPGVGYGGFNVIDSVAPLHLFLDMDAPASPELNALGSAEADSLEYIPLGGDSGAGVFALVDGQWEVIGINGTLTFDVAHVSEFGWYGVVVRLNRVAPQVPWIRRATAP